MVSLLAVVGVLAWPATLWAAPQQTAVMVVTAVVGQRSVLDITEEDEEEPPPAEQPEAGEPAAESEASKPPDDAQLPDLREEEEEAPLARQRRSARAAGADSLDTPTEEEAAEEEPPRKADVHDVLFWRPDGGSTREMPIMLSSQYLSLPLSPVLRTKQFEFQRWTASGQVKQSIRGRQIVKITYYEKRIGDQAAKALGLASLDVLAAPGGVVDLSGNPEAYKPAEKLLRTAIAEHDSAVQRKLRKGAIWNEKLRKPLVQALVNLQLGRVDLLIGERLYQQAQIECDRLAAELGASGPQWGDLRGRYERILEARAGVAFHQKDYATVRQLLDQAAAPFDGKLSETGARFQNRLIDEATRLVREAEKLKAANNPQEALDRLDEAVRIWPALPGLDGQRRQLVGDYPILHCAYAELPRSLSPLEARTPVERHAVSLVYESLVRWVDHPRSGSHYECRLAEGRPLALERGRGFYLPQCLWSDPHSARVPCTVEDVRWTVKLLTNNNLPGYSPALARLLSGVQNSPDNDPRVALVKLNRDHWQPLALMDFRVLPHPELADGWELEEELKRLRRNPVGTGPYLHAADDDPDILRLVANPYYRTAGRPGIREIVFHRLEALQAVDLFLEGKIHLIYGVRPKHVIQLRDQGRRVVCLKTPTVWFLAPNYRREPLRNRNLRLAIAHAIRREEILDQYFRPGRGVEDHVVLNGPYPADCWAYRRGLPMFQSHDETARELETSKAEVLADLARRELKSTELALRLVYPAGSEEVQQACEQIKTHVDRVGITLQLVPVAERDFYQRVIEQHDFDLAYWRHDFEDPTYWLEPLLDQAPEARRPGGPNFMAYTQDQTIAGLFAEVHLHKHFPEIQATTHKIHESLTQNAVMIPLWQLGTYVAVSETLRRKGPDGKPVELDPFDLYGDVADWELEAEPPR